MPITRLPSTRIATLQGTPLFLLLIAAGLAGNYFKFPVFLNIDFIFGSIFAMLALQFFGLGRGIVAAGRHCGRVDAAAHHEVDAAAIA